MHTIPTDNKYQPNKFGSFRPISVATLAFLGFLTKYSSTSRTRSEFLRPVNRFLIFLPLYSYSYNPVTFPVGYVPLSPRCIYPVVFTYRAVTTVPFFIALSKSLFLCHGHTNIMRNNNNGGNKSAPAGIPTTTPQNAYNTSINTSTLFSSNHP